MPVPGGGKTKLPRIPLRVGSHDFGLRSNPPAMGEGTRELLKLMGLTDPEMEQLKKEGVLAY